MGVEELTTSDRKNVIVQGSSSQVHRFHDGDVALSFGVYMESQGCEVNVDISHSPKYSNQRPSFTVRTSSKTIKVLPRLMEDYNA